ncbi:MAG TPA: ELWxxDGT repeat protein [Thermoanaerobaculia bacterium]|jgi:ELWxxDGT repeat protein|nr:ELWxxDGT repeat protein [Thermoanaerobaculia bacterium]
MLLRISALCLPLLAGPSLAFGATPVLVRDIDPRPLEEQGAAEQLVSLGDRAVFFLRANEDSRLPELWATDGTASGTERLRSFSFSGDLQSLGSNGRIAFFAQLNEETEIWQLWRTDGTAAGTLSLNVALGLPGTRFSSPFFYQDRLVFDGCTPQAGCELWTSDGTAAGTRQVRDLTPGLASSAPHGFAAAGGRLYFFADDPTGPALWTSDGSSDGTHRVVTLPPFSNTLNLVAAGDRIFFLEGGPFRFTLWTSDGTAAGTRTVPPFDHAGNRRPEVNSILGTLGGSLFFVGLDRFSSYQLWKTDGTPRGTLRLTSSPPSPPGSVLLPMGGAALGDRFVFQGADFHLWTTRGTRASTQRLAGCPGGCPLAQLNAAWLVHDGKLFFSGSTPGPGEEPWVTDGTAAGTRRLGDLCPGSCDSAPNFVTVLLGRAFFTEGPRLWATDGTAAGTALLNNDDGFTGALAAIGSRAVFATFSEDSGPGLSVTDGTAAGTRALDVHFAHGAGSNPSLFLPIGNEVRFQTCDTAPTQVWNSDGTAGGTFTLSDAAAFCTPLSRLGSDVYFIAADLSSPVGNLQVWRSDGTPGGAVPITPADRGAEALGTAGDRLVIFLQSTTSAGTELWTSDGTASSTVKVAELPDREPTHLASYPGDLPGEIVFQAVDFEFRPTLWISDGTQVGTRRLLKLFLAQDFTGFTRFNGAVYFSAGQNGLWKTDGTPAGTRQVLQDAVTEIVPFAGALFFFDQSAGTLLRSDGSLAGTNLLRDLTQDQPFSPPDPQLTAASGVLYFVAFDADHGAELWRTDGTRAGSRIVADVSPGPGSSFPAELTVAGGRLYFTANDGEHGRELWVTDGTEAGTEQVADIAAGPASSSPMALTVAGDRLFFNADDGFTGRELWLLPLSPDP